MKTNTSSVIGALALSALFILAGCQSVPETNFDYSDKTDFDRYQTFSWVGDQPLRFHTMEAHVSPLLEQHLKDGATMAFSDIGLQFVADPRRADVLMAFTVGSRERLRSDQYYGSSVYGDSSYGGYWIDSGRSLGTIMEGQVCVDLFDRRTGRPVWHGTADENLSQSELDYWRERIPVIMKYIATGYPAGNSSPE